PSPSPSPSSSSEPGPRVNPSGVMVRWRQWSASAGLRDVELYRVEVAVGTRSFDRGRACTRGGRVPKLAWDADAEALTGAVLGQGALYDTTAFFAAVVTAASGSRRVNAAAQWATTANTWRRWSSPPRTDAPPHGRCAPVR